MTQFNQNYSFESGGEPICPFEKRLTIPRAAMACCQYWVCRKPRKRCAFREKMLIKNEFLMYLKRN